MLQQLRQNFALLLRYPAFGRFWVGKLVSLFGDSMTFIALPWFVLQTTGSGAATAGIMMAIQLPAIVSGLAIGVLMDRHQPRTVIAVDNVLRAGLIGLVPILHAVDGLSLWLLYTLAICAGLLQPATVVGSRTLIPDLVDDKDLDAANMLWSFGVNLSVILGPAIAGFLVSAFGALWVLAIDALTFVTMAMAAASLPTIKRALGASTKTSVVENLGLKQLWNMKLVRITTLLSLVFFFSYGPLEAAMPVYSEQILHSDAQGYGLLWASLGVGALLGTMGSTALQKRLNPGRALPWIAALWGLCLLPVVWSTRLEWACVFLFLGGMVWGPYTPMETSLLQRNVPKDQLGRVFGARSTLMVSGAPLGLAMGGAMLTLTSPSTLIAFSSIACIVVGVAGSFSPALRNLPNQAAR